VIDTDYDIAKTDGDLRVAKRKLLLRDSVVFMTLLLITVALYGVTLFLFRSFESRREDMAREWAAKGETALQQGQAANAVSALRAALSYAPDEHAYQLLLAEALAASGRSEEANNYFLNLWTARPGDGFINLQLARLARQHQQTQEAVDYYRAAIYGDWQGDGIQRRRETRLELADYLEQVKNFGAARTELLVVAGNAPDNAGLNLLIGDRLTAIGDTTDALTYYQRAVTDDPHNYLAFAKAGLTAYQLGDFETAHTLLSRAAHVHAARGAPEVDPALARQVAAASHNAERLMQLSMSPELPPAERARHIILAATIAQARLKACAAQATPPGAPPAFPVLTARWKLWDSNALRHQMPSNALAQDSMMHLVFDTELQTAAVCRAPNDEDNTLLLELAKHPPGENVAAGGGTS
jgi:tetratricopeptide (TPR) repeat protein